MQHLLSTTLETGSNGSGRPYINENYLLNLLNISSLFKTSGKEVYRMKLNVRAFALTCGIFWGLGLFSITWWLIAFGGVSDDPTFIGRIYLGYRISPLGSIIGLAWASADGFIAGAVFAWLYNRIISRILSTKE
jgi:hypothetical protein